MIWEDKFTTPPTPNTGFTMITVTHPYHGVKQFWLPVDKFQELLVTLIGTYWANGFTIIIQESN